MIRRIHASILLAFVALVGGCVEGTCSFIEVLPGGPACPTYTDPSYLAVGDSIMATNGPLCEGIPGWAARDLGFYIEDHSAGGRRLTHPRSGDDIMSQYTEGSWEWVMMTGGGDDLVFECRCTEENHNPDDCEAVLDALALPDESTGDIYEFIDMVNLDDQNLASILILGYYTLPEDTPGNFDACNPYVLDLNRRYQEVADQEENVFLMETAGVMDFDTHPEYFLIDDFHPSSEGSAVLGSMVAAFIQSH